jgi:DNA-binding response OmpR family regulator
MKFDARRSDMSTILVLDDDRVFLRLVVEALEKRGHRVLPASRAAEADRLMQAEDPDLLLVDGLLPDITGVQWVEKIRAAGRQTQVLLITSFWKSMRAFAVAAAELGPIRLLHKPLEPDEVADRVDAALEDAAKPPHRTRRK